MELGSEKTGVVSRSGGEWDQKVQTEEERGTEQIWQIDWRTTRHPTTARQLGGSLRMAVALILWCRRRRSCFVVNRFLWRLFQLFTVVPKLVLLITWIEKRPCDHAHYSCSFRFTSSKTPFSDRHAWEYDQIGGECTVVHKLKLIAFIHHGNDTLNTHIIKAKKNSLFREHLDHWL